MLDQSNLNIEEAPAVVNTKYSQLGHRTFWIFFSEGATPAMIIGIVAIMSGMFMEYEAMRFLFALSTGFFFFVLIGAALISYLRYTRYEYLLDRDAMRIKRGVLNKEEIAIPYRMIQHVEINRPLHYQFLGVSHITILTTADNDDAHDDHRHKKEGVIPAIDKALASHLQTELLSRANIQKFASVEVYKSH
ncbi:MAG: PH domain-containing protein [Parcubacteria group bacterium]